MQLTCARDQGHLVSVSYCLHPVQHFPPIFRLWGGRANPAPTTTTTTPIPNWFPIAQTHPLAAYRPFMSATRSRTSPPPRIILISLAPTSLQNYLPQRPNIVRLSKHPWTQENEDHVSTLRLNTSTTWKTNPALVRPHVIISGAGDSRNFSVNTARSHTFCVTYTSPLLSFPSRETSFLSSISLTITHQRNFLKMRMYASFFLASITFTQLFGMISPGSEDPGLEGGHKGKLKSNKINRQKRGQKKTIWQLLTIVKRSNNCLRCQAFESIPSLLGISASGSSPAGVCLHSDYHVNTILPILRPRSYLSKKYLLAHSPPSVGSSSIQHSHKPTTPADNIGTTIRTCPPLILRQQDAMTATLRIP